MDLTERHDLRSSAAPWDDGDLTLPPSDALPTRIVDVAICGAGIMGATLAERLSAAGLSVALLDRRAPGHGSTSASTALVLWEIDMPLITLARRLGEDAAVARWRRVHDVASALRKRCSQEKIAAEWQERPSLYLDGDLLDAEGLRAEAALRRKHGFPSVFLPPEQSSERFGIKARSAIVSGDSYETNPLALTLALLARARSRGATASYPADVLRLNHKDDVVVLATDKGDVRARHVILACGYERPRLLLPEAFTLRSSYAVASAPGIAPLWREQALIWEAAHNYHYARMDSEGRVIAGGGDEAFNNPQHRDALIPEKTQAIAANLAEDLGVNIEPRERWAAIFGASPDGLPAIGRANNSENVWLASGFGGNGITFAALAAELLTNELTGKPDPDLACFNPYRFGGSTG